MKFLARSTEYLPLLLLLPLAGLCYLVYQAGFSGDFIFDDLPNLAPLAEIPTPLTLAGITDFIFSGISTSLGRPLSLLTFALQAQSWPEDVAAFKAVNLGIHLLNGLLVYLLVLQVGKRVAPAQRHWISLLVTALWLMHPLHVSTVTYVVQRMNLLSAFFVLTGINIYLVYRNSGPLTLIRMLSLLFVTGLCTLLGILSKENAILLPLYILVFEWTLHATAEKHGYWRTYRLLGLWLPIGFLVGYLAMRFPSILESYAIRPFDMHERLLSESRVLITYLGQIIAPLPSKLGVFQDDFVISRGLLAPATTLLCLLAIIGALASAVILRYRFPVFAFAILWFFAGHSLEAGIVNLELYFEHRNYLPALGILLGLVVLAYRVTAGNRKMTNVATATFLLVVTFFSWQGYQESAIWGDEEKQATIWYHEHPESKRARQRYAAKLLQLGRTGESYELIASISRDWPDDSGSRLMKFMFQCFHSDLDAEPVERLAEHLRVSSYDSGTIKQLHDLTDWIATGKCRSVSAGDLEAIAGALLENPAFNQPKAQGNIYFDMARANAIRGDHAAAARLMGKAYEMSGEFTVMMMSISYWLMAGETDAAALALDELEADLDQSLKIQNDIHEAVANLRLQLEKSQRESDEP